ncbi:MAG: hypothetical protein AAGF86_14655, partial [Pseudomonadota bacterium]
MSEHTCTICSGPITKHPQFGDLPRVASDAKPWPKGGEIAVCEVCGFVQKPATDAFLADAEQIYASYQMYEIADGTDQPIFDDSGSSAPRSQKIVDFLASQPGIPQKGSIIDIGCGSGTALGVISQTFPEWRIFGN